jgi:hypothetical protein
MEIFRMGARRAQNERSILSLTGCADYVRDRLARWDGAEEPPYAGAYQRRVHVAHDGEHRVDRLVVAAPALANGCKIECANLTRDSLSSPPTRQGGQARSRCVSGLDSDERKREPPLR